MTNLRLFLSVLLVCFVAVTANAQKLGALVSTNLVRPTDTFPLTTDGGSNTFKVTLNAILMSNAPMSGPFVMTTTNTATTVTPMLILSNATPATAGVTVQGSPAFYQSGHAWLTGSLSNAPVVFRSYVYPAVGATTPSATWALDSSVNGAAFTTPLTINSLGLVNISGNAFVGGDVRVAGANSFYWVSRSVIQSPSDGAIKMLNQASSAISTSQANIPQVTKTSNYTNATRLDSGLRLVNIGAVAAVTNFLETAVAQDRHFYYVDAAQVLSVKAAAGDVIHNAGTPTSSGGDIWSSTQYSTLMLFCPKAGHWVVEAITGTWAVN